MTNGDALNAAAEVAAADVSTLGRTRRRKVARNLELKDE